MAECKHEIGFLMGTADGIVCRNCGKLFHSFDEIHQKAEEPEKKPVKTGRKKKDD